MISDQLWFSITIMNTVLIPAVFGDVVTTVVFMALGVGDLICVAVSAGLLVVKGAIVLVAALVAICISVRVGAGVGD